MQGVFVIRGVGVETDSAVHEVDFDQVHDSLISPALKLCASA